MEVGAKFMTELRKRAAEALSTPDAELEARVYAGGGSAPSGAAAFNRALSYFTSTRGGGAQAKKTLDVISGGVRASTSSEEHMGLMCAEGAPVGDAPDLVIVRKESAAPRLELTEYDCAVDLSREVPVSDRGILDRGGPRGRLYFRLKERASFPDETGNFSVDLTMVKQGAGRTPASLSSAQVRYEVEVELVSRDAYPDTASGADRCAEDLLSAVGEVLLALRGTGEVLLRRSEINRALGHYKRLTTRGGDRPVFVGPQPVTLERRNLMDEGPGRFSIREGYTVTEKADGARRLLYLDGDGRGYLLDQRMRVSSAGVSSPGAANSVFDGELVRKDRSGRDVSLFMAFDCYFFLGDDKRDLPLLAPGGGEGRLDYVRKGGERMSGGGMEFVAKEFAPLEDAARVYRYKTLSSPYPVDGLILTPSGLGVFRNFPGEGGRRKESGAWLRAFKWKPPEESTVDFMVKWDKTSIGDVVVDSRGMMNARLLVVSGGEGSSFDVYRYLGASGEGRGQDAPAGPALDDFAPPGYGLGDPSGYRAPAPPDRGLPRCEQAPHDAVEDGAIVEFRWDTGASSWSPLRVRSDKTMPNFTDTAASVWASIAFPVSLEDVADPYSASGDAPSSLDDVYYAREAGRRVRNTHEMRRFHLHVKSWLYKAAAEAHRSSGAEGEPRLLDLASGKGGDLNAWVESGYASVLGVDSVRDNLLNPGDGAYARASQLAKRRSGARGLLKDPLVLFVLGDVSRPLGEEAGGEAKDGDPGARGLLELKRSVFSTRPAEATEPRLSRFRGMGRQPFDAAACQFAVHYFFGSRGEAEGFLRNVAGSLRPGGVFVGTCLDGSAVDRAFAEASGDVIQEAAPDGGVMWRIRKMYDGRLGDAASEDNFGKRVSVFQESINKEATEYLVDFDLLVALASEAGLHLPGLGELPGVETGSDTFESSFRDVESMGGGGLSGRAADALAMTPPQKRYSFMNRWFAFVKK